MADRLRVCFFWLFTAGIIAGLWMYADARSRVAQTPATLPPPGWPTTQPGNPPRQFSWHSDVSAGNSLSAPDVGEIQYSD